MQLTPPAAPRALAAMPEHPSSSATLVPAMFLALDTFAIGTEGFMIAPMLPTMAADFGRSVPSVALLVVVFTLTLALSSPVSTVLTARWQRRNTLLLAMALFAAGNLLASWSPGFGVLMLARILMAVAAGLYVPSANALAGTLVPAPLRGRALAIVSGGMTLAIALGLPLGALVGHAFGWRATFLAVGGMGLVAIGGTLFGIPARAGAGIAPATLADRVAALRRPAVLRLLSVSLLWAMGAFAAYPYIAPYLGGVLGFGPQGVMLAVSVWGVSAALGVLAGGTLADRFGPHRVAGTSLLALVLAFWTLSAASGLPPRTALLPVLLGVVLWGFTVWSFFPAQMARLIGAGGAPQASLVLALNTSTMYLGFSIGSALGAAVLGTGALWGIGLLAGALEAAAFALDRRAQRHGAGP